MNAKEYAHDLFVHGVSPDRKGKPPFQLTASPQDMSNFGFTSNLVMAIELYGMPIYAIEVVSTPSLHPGSPSIVNEGDMVGGMFRPTPAQTLALLDIRPPQDYMARRMLMLKKDPAFVLGVVQAYMIETLWYAHRRNSEQIVIGGENESPEMMAARLMQPQYVLDAIANMLWRVDSMDDIPLQPANLVYFDRLIDVMRYVAARLSTGVFTKAPWPQTCYSEILTATIDALRGEHVNITWDLDLNHWVTEEYRPYSQLGFDYNPTLKAVQRSFDHIYLRGGPVGGRHPDHVPPPNYMASNTAGVNEEDYGRVNEHTWFYVPNQSNGFLVDVDRTAIVEVALQMIDAKSTDGMFELPMFYVPNHHLLVSPYPPNYNGLIGNAYTDMVSSLAKTLRAQEVIDISKAKFKLVVPPKNGTPETLTLAMRAAHWDSGVHVTRRGERFYLVFHGTRTPLSNLPPDETVKRAIELQRNGLPIMEWFPSRSVTEKLKAMVRYVYA